MLLELEERETELFFFSPFERNATPRGTRGCVRIGSDRGAITWKLVTGLRGRREGGSEREGLANGTGSTRVFSPVRSFHNRIVRVSTGAALQTAAPLFSGGPVARSAPKR